ncbi:MAG TPA: hypothetical protein VF190_11975 [Rhodothermales bacterium]
MDAWIAPERGLPDEKEEVTVRVRGEARTGYYRIGERWYAATDLHRWRMNTSPYWKKDRSWYLKTEQIEAWRSA